MFRHEKDSNFVELEEAIIKRGVNSIIVNQEGAFEDGNWPVEFYDPVPSSDRKKVAKLQSNLKKWAKDNGFKPS